VSDGLKLGYDLKRWTMEAQILTGHNTGSPERCWVIISFFVSRFCILNVIETQSAAVANYLSECGMRRFPLKNLTLLTQSSLVFLGPWTLTYLQDRMAKKKAPMKSLHSALSVGDIDRA
jgi:hypothetical protein